MLSSADFYEVIREQLVEQMQSVLRPIRNMLSLSANELGTYLGLTRQSINNLELQKTPLSSLQYIAVCAVLDELLSRRPELLSPIETLLESQRPSQSAPRLSFSYQGSFLKRWFLAFPDSAARDPCRLKALDEKQRFAILANEFRVLLDSTSLLYLGAQEKQNSAFWRLAGEMKQTGNRLIIPQRAVEEIERLREAHQAGCAYGILVALQQQELLEIRGEATDPNTQETILAVARKHRHSRCLLVITQNEPLAGSLLRLGGEPGGHAVLTAYLCENRMEFYACPEEGPPSSPSPMERTAWPHPEGPPSLTVEIPAAPSSWETLD